MCTSNYSQTQLDNFVLTLNQYKRKILHYAFLGTNPDIVPTYLFGVEYVNDSRNKIVLMKIQDIIDYLETLDFKISKEKRWLPSAMTVYYLCSEKGGDGGKKGSNQLQVKLIVSKLLDKIQNLQYILMKGSRMVLKTLKKISFIESIRKYLGTFLFLFFHTKLFQGFENLLRTYQYNITKCMKNTQKWIL